MSFMPRSLPYADKERFYKELLAEIEAFCEPTWYTALANVSASLMQHLPEINWVGFYLFAEGELVLGPFQGLPACTRIKLGKGVCGTAAAERRTLVVPDVDLFPGHIACDSASRSEIVIPIISPIVSPIIAPENAPMGAPMASPTSSPATVGRLLGVLDVDSPILNRFDSTDEAGLFAIASLVAQRISF